MTICKNYYCKEKIDYGHNGLPLFEGRVCDNCNKLVIEERIKNLKKY